MDASLEAVKRDGRGKNEANRLRASGRIPAVVYGTRKSGEGATAVSVDPKAVLRILHSESGANTLINLRLDGNEARVMVKEYQLDPVTHQLLHADFYKLAMDKAITVTVPVVLKGEARGVNIGVADTARRNADQHLPLGRFGHNSILNHERFPKCPNDRGLHLHGGLLTL